MKKIALYVVTMITVFMLSACDPVDLTYDFIETTHDIGVETCYVSGDEVIINPIIRVGYTIEEEDEDGYENEFEFQWVLEEFGFVLEKEEAGAFVEMDSDTVSTELSDNQYEEYSYTTGNDLIDYGDYINEEFFNLGELEAGNYRYELTTVSRYMRYSDVYNTTNKDRDTSQGVKTHEESTIVEFIVSDSCVSEFTGTLVFEYNWDYNAPNLEFFGIDNEGNILSIEDVVLFEDILDGYDFVYNLDDYYNDDSDYEDKRMLSYNDLTENTDVNYNIVSREYVNDCNGCESDFSIEEYLTYKDYYYDYTMWNGSFLKEFTNYYLNTNDYEDMTEENGTPEILNDFYLTLKLKDSDVYQDILVIAVQEENPPVFSNVPMDQSIVIGENLDLEAMMPTAVDDTEGDVSSRIEVELPDTTTLALGDHEITYTVSDYFGNEAEASFTLTVLPVDTVSPVITVNDEMSLTIDQYSEVPDFTTYFTIVDGRDGNIPVTEMMLSYDTMFDINTVGFYDITITVTDAAGNEATETITIEVVFVDNTPPVITDNLDLNFLFTEGDDAPDITTYFSVLDDTDGIIEVTEAMLSWSPALDMNAAGSYLLTLTVSDAVGNTSTSGLIFTIVEAPDLVPEFANIPLNQTITEGDSLDLLTLGLTASDDVDGDITTSITVDITDTSVLSVGTHTATYSVTDSAGNTVTITIDILVEEAVSMYSGAVVSATATSEIDIDIIFDVFYLDNFVADLTAFTVIVDGVESDVTAIQIEFDNIILTIEDMMSINSVVTVSYNATGTDDLEYDFEKVPNFTNQVVDTTDFETGTDLYTGDVSFANAFDANTVDVALDVDALDNTVLDETAFTITINGVNATITNSFIDTNMISFIVTETMGEFDTIEISYAPTGTNDLTFGGTPVPSFTNELVYPPTSEGGGGMYTGNVTLAAAFDANTIDITFDVDTFDNAVIDLTAFTVMIDGVEATITSSFVNINMVSLTITETMDEFTFVEVSYTPTGTNDLSYGGILVTSFVDEPVLPPGEGGFPGF
jgi:hypothetical protein